MSDIEQDPIAARIERATSRLAQLQARRMLKDMRLASAARVQARKLATRRRFELGEAIDRAGFADWAAADVMGLLLVARDQFGDAETARSLMRERARQGAQVTSNARG